MVCSDLDAANSQVGRHCFNCRFACTRASAMPTLLQLPLRLHPCLGHANAAGSVQGDIVLSAAPEWRVFNFS